MQRSISEGWDELERGHHGEARQIFDTVLKAGGDQAEAHRGLAQLDMRDGNLERAEKHARRGLAARPTVELQLTLAQIIGEQGNRRQAEGALKEVVSANPKNAFARALYAEQILRQGRWEEGTNQFIAALSEDPTGEAFAHFRQVVADLIDAFLAGRMPEQTAMQFINRVDYAIPKANREVGYFFGAARRAITGRQALVVEQAPPARRSSPQRLVRPDVSPDAPAQYSHDSAPQPARRPQAASHTRSQRSRGESHQQPHRPAQSPPPQPHVDANQKDIKALIQHERALNRDLLDGIAQMEPAKWPSESGYAAIDTISPIELRRDSLLGVSSDIDTRDFRVTTGNLDTEIFLERCLRNLLVATQEKKTVTLVARPSSVWQMELNCRDGLLDKVAPPSDLYRELEDFDDYAQLSLGVFIGDILETVHDGTWTYQSPASESFIELGDKILRPFEQVAEWMQADDKDDVNLEILTRLAKQATRRSTSMTILQNYIDPTAGLTPDAISATLATLWTSYRFSLGEADVATIGDEISVEETDDAAIVFTLPLKWAPDYCAGPDGAGLLAGQRVALAYLRGSGEFVALASRKGFASYLEMTANGLNESSARRAIDALALFHRPGWHVATDKSSAARLSKQTGQEISAPRIAANRHRSQLEVLGICERGPVRWLVEFDREALIPWRLEVQH